MMDSLKLKFLIAQVQYDCTHIGIADTKAAGIIAYISVITGYTVTRVDVSRDAAPTLNQWLAIGSIALAAAAVCCCLLAILPRRKRGIFGPDTFSWVCIAEQRKHGSLYRDRVGGINPEQMEQSLADTIDGMSLTIRAKYDLVQAALWLTLLSSLGQAVYWFFR